MALLDNILYSPGEPIQDMYDKINAAIDQINAVLGGGTADQIIKKSDGVDFNTIMTNSVLPDTGVPNLKIKVLNIGDWNMDTTSNKIVAHGISDYKKIRMISVIIRDDSDSGYTCSPYLDPSDLLSHNFDVPGSLNLFRANGSFYDSVNFDSTSYNRGFITIIYEG